MKLYHGSTESALVPILEHGIKPRGTKKGNWQHTITSNKKAVYLTDAYPLHFAMQAAKKGERLLVLEVETEGLDLFKFAPDEDLLEQGTRKDERFAHVPGTEPFDMKKRTKWFRERALSDFAQFWRLSLEKMGTVCYYGDIPRDHITRYALIKPSAEVIMASDPTICPLNYMIMGAYYRQLSRLLFGDKPDLSDVDEHHAKRLEWMYEHPEKCLLKGSEVVDLRETVDA